MSNPTIYEQLQRIEFDITKLTHQEDNIRVQIKALRAEHAKLISAFLAPTTTPIPKQAAEAATQVAQVKDPSDRHALAVEKASGLVRKILGAHPNGLEIDGILAEVGILAPTASHRYDLESLLSTMNKAGQVRTVSRDGVNFKYFLEGATDHKQPEPVSSTPSPVDSRMGQVMGKISALYRAGHRTVMTGDLFPVLASFPMASIRHAITHALINLGILGHTTAAHTYSILRDPCGESGAVVPTPEKPKGRTAQELDDLYVQAVSKAYRTKAPPMTIVDFTSLDPDGSQNYPLQVMDVLSRLHQGGVLVRVGGNHYKAVRDPLAPAPVPTTAAAPAAAPSTASTTRFHPSSHGDYPPGVHVVTRELLDHMRTDAGRTYTVDDIVSWLGSRGVASANIRTRASHILASLVGFGCLNRTGSGKYTLRDYRGYKNPQHNQEK